MNLVREIESECGEKFQLPFSIPQNIEEGLSAIPKDIWTLNFYCPVCRRIEKIQKQRLVWVQEETKPKFPDHLSEVAFQLAVQCDEESCKTRIELLVLGGENESAANVLHKHVPMKLKVACSHNHPPTLVDGRAIPIKLLPYSSPKPDTERFIEFFSCRNCNKPFRAPFSMSPLLTRILPSLSKDSPIVVFACEGCNDLRPYNTHDLPPPSIYDKGEGGLAVYVGKVFRVIILCADNNCESRIKVIAPTPSVYEIESIRAKSHHWKPKNVSCSNRHPARIPIEVSSVEELGWDSWSKPFLVQP